MRVGLFVALTAMACARVDADAPSDSGVDAPGNDSGVSDSGCVGATSGAYACGTEVRACDPNAPTGLPTGACTAGQTCEITVRPANCRCDEDDGPRFFYSCACAGGSWRCTAGAPDGRTCGCSINPPYAASCETPPSPTGTDPRRAVTLEPLPGERAATIEPRVTLQGSSPPSAELKLQIVNTIRLYSFALRAWVRADVALVPVDGPFVAWTVRPRDFPLRGEWAVRVGPLPKEPGVHFFGPLVYCDGYAETRFTVLGE